MSNEVMTRNSEWMNHIVNHLNRMVDNFERAVMNYRPMLGGERFMTDKELCARLQLSRRTLQDYRNNGVIPYIQLGGKILYRESVVIVEPKHHMVRLWVQLRDSSPLFSFCVHIKMD